MSSQHLRPLVFVVSIGLCAATLSLAVAAPDFTEWFIDADGMLAATKAYDAEAKPIFVYFHTTWCGYCRQFERELLSVPEVSDYMGSILAVRIDMEKGPSEMALARRYGVRGTPALFVHSAESKTVSRVERIELVNGRPRLKSAGAFIDAIKQAGAR